MVELDQSVFVSHLLVRMSFLKQALPPDLRRMWIPGKVARELVWQGWAAGHVAVLKMQAIQLQNCLGLPSPVVCCRKKAASREKRRTMTCLLLSDKWANRWRWACCAHPMDRRAVPGFQGAGR